MSISQPGPRTPFARAIVAFSMMVAALGGQTEALNVDDVRHASIPSSSDARPLRLKWQVERAVTRSSDLSTVQAAVMLALLSLCDPDEGTAYPSLSTIANMAKCSRRTAITALQWLVALGWVSVTPRWRLSDRGDRERQRTNLYRLHIPPPALQDVSLATSTKTRPAPAPEVPAHVRRVEEPRAPLVPLAHVASAAISTPAPAIPPVRPAEPSPELGRHEEIRSALASFDTLREFSENLDVAAVLDEVAQRNGKGLLLVLKALGELDHAIRLEGRHQWPRQRKAAKLRTFVENVRPEPEEPAEAAPKPKPAPEPDPLWENHCAANALPQHQVAAELRQRSSGVIQEIKIALGVAPRPK